MNSKSCICETIIMLMCAICLAHAEVPARAEDVTVTEDARIAIGDGGSFFELTAVSSLLDAKFVGVAMGSMLDGGSALSLVDLSANRVLHQFDIEDGPACTISLLAGGKRAAIETLTGAGKSSFAIWNVKGPSEEFIESFATFREKRTFDVNEKWCVIGDLEGNVRVLSTRRLDEEAKSLGRQKEGVTAVALSSKEDIVSIARGNESNRTSSVEVWNIESQKLLGRTRPLKSLVFQLVFSPNGKHVVASTGRMEGDNGTCEVTLIDVARPERSSSLASTKGIVSALQFSDSGDRLALSISTGPTKLESVLTSVWDVAKVQQVTALPKKEAEIQSVAFAGENYLLMIDRQGHLIIANAANGSVVVRRGVYSQYANGHVWSVPKTGVNEKFLTAGIIMDAEGKRDAILHRWSLRLQQ